MRCIVDGRGTGSHVHMTRDIIKPRPPMWTLVCAFHVYKSILVLVSWLLGVTAAFFIAAIMTLQDIGPVLFGDVEGIIAYLRQRHVLASSCTCTRYMSVTFIHYTLYHEKISLLVCIDV